MRRELPLVMVSHAAFPAVTKDKTPASLSKKWITDILRKKIGYRGLIASDDLEMGGVLAAAPIEQAAIGHIRAGGDLCLICHQEDFIFAPTKLLAAKPSATGNLQSAYEDRRVACLRSKRSICRRGSSAAHRCARGEADPSALGIRRASSAGRA